MLINTLLFLVMDAVTVMIVRYACIHLDSLLRLIGFCLYLLLSKVYLSCHNPHQSTFFKSFETLNSTSLHTVTHKHGLDPEQSRNKSALRNELCLHLTGGLCKKSAGSACNDVLDECAMQSDSADALQVHILSSVCKPMYQEQTIEACSNGALTLYLRTMAVYPENTESS